MTILRQETVPLEGGERMRALLALPEGTPPEGGWPVVIAIHDIFGFSPDVHRIAGRFAESGYAALAPALYDGAGAPFLCVVRTLRDQQLARGPPSRGSKRRADFCKACRRSMASVSRSPGSASAALSRSTSPREVMYR